MTYTLADVVFAGVLGLVLGILIRWVTTEVRETRRYTSAEDFCEDHRDILEDQNR